MLYSKERGNGIDQPFIDSVHSLKTPYFYAITLVKLYIQDHSKYLPANLLLSEHLRLSFFCEHLRSLGESDLDSIELWAQNGCLKGYLSDMDH